MGTGWGREPSKPVRASFSSVESEAAWEQKEQVWETQGAWGQVAEPQSTWKRQLSSLPSTLNFSSTIGSFSQVVSYYDESTIIGLYLHFCPCILELNCSKDCRHHSWLLSTSQSLSDPLPSGFCLSQCYEPVPWKVCRGVFTTGLHCSDSLLRMCTWLEKPLNRKHFLLSFFSPQAVRCLQSSDSSSFFFSFCTKCKRFLFKIIIIMWNRKNYFIQ